MLIRLIKFQKFEPHLNMAIDEAISIFVRQGKTLPTLRFYGWDRKAVTIGEFQKIEEINHGFCIKNNIPIIRRPTGGKGILHDNDITYSFSARKEGIFCGGLFQTYRILGRIFAKAFILTGIPVQIKEEKGFNNKSSLCFAVSCFGEICFKDKKIIGSAQKRWIDGFLQQGTIPVTINRKLLKKIFFSHPEDAEKIYGIKELYNKFDIEIFQENVRKALLEEGFEVVAGSLQKEEFLFARKFLLKNYQLPDNKKEMKQIQPC